MNLLETIPPMEYVQVPGLAQPVSRIIFGTAIGSMVNGKDVSPLLDAVFQAGINTFDTARLYGGSEQSLGTWIQKRDNRNQVRILTKCCSLGEKDMPLTPQNMEEELSRSLTALQTDYVDLFAAHNDNPQAEPGPIMETFNDLKAQGKIRCFGVSNWTHLRMEQANEYAYKHNLSPLSFGSPAFSLAEMIGDPWGGSVHLSGPDNQEARAWYRSNHLPVFAYSALARGFFSGKYRTEMGDQVAKVLHECVRTEYYYPENVERLKRAEQLAAEYNVTVGQICLAWILAQEEITVCPITGPSNTKHLQENLEALRIQLTKEECRWLNLEE